VNPYAPKPVYAFPSYYAHGHGGLVGREQMDPAVAAPADAKYMQTNSDLKWKVDPDLGELDDHSTLYREYDMDYEKGGKKFSGWSNPLSWTDDGADDDVVLFQMKSKIKYDESGFDTPADKGLDDDTVVNFVQIKVHDDEKDHEEGAEDDINTVLHITNEDLNRTPEKINIEHSAKADNGLDDDQVV